MRAWRQARLEVSAAGLAVAGLIHVTYVHAYGWDPLARVQTVALLGLLAFWVLPEWIALRRRGRRR